VNVSNPQTRAYYDACQYALKTLGEGAPRYFARLLQLSRYNTSEELTSIIDGWCPVGSQPPPVKPSGEWSVGAKWGDTVRVGNDGGIMWRLRCSCGKLFRLSTNDTVKPEHRKCDTCILADELSETKKELVSRLDEVSNLVLEWHKAHDKLIWNRVHKACAKRGIPSDWTGTQFKKELHALVWVKIAEKAGQYRDKGFKPSAWLGRVADNAIKDYFKVNDNRARLAPTTPIVAEDGRDAAAPATKPEEALPAKKVSSEGASPYEGALNKLYAAWDDAQKWNR